MSQQVEAELAEANEGLAEYGDCRIAKQRPSDEAQRMFQLQLELTRAQSQLSVEAEKARVTRVNGRPSQTNVSGKKSIFLVGPQKRRLELRDIRRT